jgi:flagellar biosynthesis/type III secretory pathway M-ring protein FliF/YscJ
MQQIEALVKSAIGYDKSRGDQVQVVNMPFAKVDLGPSTPAARRFWVSTRRTGSRSSRPRSCRSRRC